jgi:hypothetical protein
VLVAFRWPGAFFITLAHGLSVVVRRNAAPCRIIGPGKESALARRLAAGISNATFNETALPVKLFSTNYTLKCRPIKAVGPWSWLWSRIFALAFEFTARFGNSAFDQALWSVKFASANHTSEHSPLPAVWFRPCALSHAAAFGKRCPYGGRTTIEKVPI